MSPIRTKRRLLRVEKLESRWMFHGDPLADLVAEGEAGPLPDFALVDVNSTSGTFEQQVSPRNYIGEVSGYYFGNAM